MRVGQTEPDPGQARRSLQLRLGQGTTVPPTKDERDGSTKSSQGATAHQLRPGLSAMFQPNPTGAERVGPGHSDKSHDMSGSPTPTMAQAQHDGIIS
jgi:hypothetical protein